MGFRIEVVDKLVEKNKLKISSFVPPRYLKENSFFSRKSWL